VSRRRLVVATLAIVGALVLATAAPAQEPLAGPADLETRVRHLFGELGAAAVRLPLAAALGAVLAARPRRRGVPARRSEVIETQIVLAVVGALVMLVVGASLARAFGIVGIASLIRYRSKINDPKDAVVMLSALAVGLACGTGQFALAVFSTLFLGALLWFLEGFERPTRTFELAVRLGPASAEKQSEIENVLRRFELEFELRGASEEGATYFVTAPHRLSTNRVSRALAALAADGKGAVEWVEKPPIPSK
jgi:hypothetical protein